MDIFEYIATHDEYAAKAIVNKYGYAMTGPDTAESLGVSLQEVVNAEGEPAMLDILAIHPDKDVIVETFGASQKKGDCGCSGKKEKKALEAYLPSANSGKPDQTTIFVFAGALLLAAAIIAK